MNDPHYLDKTLQKYSKHVHKKNAIIPAQQTPSIPSKKLAQTAYTGRNLDTVGPAVYNPKLSMTKSKTAEHDFSANKIQRRPFDPSDAKKAIPGPGVYEFEILGQKNFNSSGQYSVFQSRVPNCKDKPIKNIVPGPGAYQTVASIEKSSMENQAQNADGQIMGQEPRSFLSKTKRNDFWRNDAETPYTKQTFHKNPGPGQYDHEKKKDDVKNKIIAEETVNTAFNSSEARPCNKNFKNPNPGPGTYIDINNPQHCAFKVYGSQINKDDRNFQEE